MKLLLHACCGPCSLEPVRLLKEEGHDITIAYMNSNIAPASEYQHRLSTLLDWAKAQDIPVIEEPYEPARWQEAIRNAWHPHSSNSDSTQTYAHTKQTSAHTSAHTNHEASAPRASFPLEASSAFATSSEFDASPPPPKQTRRQSPLHSTLVLIPNSIQHATLNSPICITTAKTAAELAIVYDLKSSHVLRTKTDSKVLEQRLP